MHPTEVDEGVLLADRYRVAALLAQAPGDGGAVAQTWRAVDSVLSRSVVIHVLAADDTRADHVLEASRRAATVDDVRFLRVLDALREDGIAYVVREWVEGQSLAELLAEGPIPPRDAGLVIREVAEAIGRAHDQELYHERLDPDSVVITEGGTIKIVGLATQAALDSHEEQATGAEPFDPVRADTIGLGRLLYTALTGRWPIGPISGLPAAPRAADGTLLSPRQCRAGVPRSLDEITERILSERPRHGSPLRRAQDIVDALTGTVGSTPAEGVLASSRPAATSTGLLADPANDKTTAFGVGPAPGYTSAGYTPAAAGRPSSPPQPPAHGPTGGGRPPGSAAFDHRPISPRYAPAPRTEPRWARIGVVLVSILLVAGLGLLGWQLVTQTTGNGQEPTDDTSDLPGAPTGRGEDDPPFGEDENEGGEDGDGPYDVTDAGDFDPPPGNGEENPAQVPNAIDGDPNTYWQTLTYYDPMEILKPGVGIWFDLGEPRDVGTVELTLYGDDADLEIRVAPEDAETPPGDAGGWTVAAGVEGAGTTEEITFEDSATTRYVLVWYTRLAPEGGDYKGGISEITIGP